LLVNDRGTPQSVTTTVNFDTPAPPGGPGPFDGVFQGIDFGTGQWAWSGPYDVDPTNNVYFANSTGTSRTFAFSPAPRVLQSLRVYGSRAGTLTLTDDAGQTWTQEVATGSMQLVTTGWTRPATTVTVSFTAGWSLGVDDITYSTSSAAQDPSMIGQWSAVMAWPIAPVHTLLQPSGEVLVWDRFNAGPGARIWNPNTGAFTVVPAASDLFCGGHTALADGRSVVIGGHVEPCCQTGLPDTNIYDSVTQTWTRAADMSARRWYPTATTLPDGRILATSGWSTPGQLADVPEVYDPGTNTWSALTAAARRSPMYAFMFVLPDGTVFEAGPGVVNGAGSTMTWRLDVNAQRWTAVGDSLFTGGSAVMYAPGRVMKSGTLGDPQFPLPSVDGRTALIDMNQPSPAWRQVASMAFPRSYHTLTLLPDGTVVSTGGEQSTSGDTSALAVYEAELWNPATETWTTLARMQRPRMYHSTAILLPDARVLVSGGQLGTYLESNAEIYSPPYLFRGPRPSITSVPQTLAYGTGFFVDTPDASTITGVSLVRLGTTTHSFNHNQRYLALSFTQEATGLTVQAPANGNLAPPGYYMLFIVNANGVPSVAQFVRFPSQVATTTTTVSFDSPPPPGGPGPLDGVFQGIDFGAGQWVWEGPYNVDPTNNVYFADSTGTARTFAFSPAPRVLETLRVFTTRAGTLMLFDDAGQTRSQDVATGSMQLVTTGWTRPSTTVTVSFTMGWSLGIDDITYRTEP